MWIAILAVCPSESPEEGNNTFTEDFKEQILLCKETDKRCSVVEIRLKMSENIELKKRWCSLTFQNIKDKIWSLSKKLKRDENV